MTARRRVPAVPALVVAAALLAAGCSSGGDGAGDRAGDGGGDGGTATLDVLAAASLTETFGALAERFEEDHPGVEVRLVLESSTTLATQVVEGAPADVLATADETSMQLAVDAGSAQDPQRFATNELVLVTPLSNPGGILSVDDLDEPDVAFVACVPTAPCGAVAEGLLAANEVTAEPRSLEVDVKAVLAKVVADEADAGLVYASDAWAARNDVTTWPVPGSDEQLNPYLISVVEQTDDADLAREWIDLVLSADGQDVLAGSGFGPADAADGG